MNDGYALKAALTRMVVLRFCPPDDKLSNDHVRKCPFCRDWINSIGLRQSNLARESVDILMPSEIKPGQIWRTDESLAGYDDEDRYHNPLLVMVIEKITDKIVRVAPVHFEEALAFAGDVEIDRGLFVEMWNTFPFPVRYLARYEGTFEVPPVSEQTAEPPTQVHRYFRKMEAEVVAVLVFKVWDELMENYAADVADVIADLGNSIVIDAKCPDNISGVLDRLALAVPSDEYDISSCMAAADSTEEERIIAVNVAHLTPLRVYVKTVLGRITFWEDNGERLEIGGQVTGEFSDDAGIHAVWKHRETGDVLARAELAVLDPQTGFFRIVFSRLPKEDRHFGDLALLICTR